MQLTFRKKQVFEEFFQILIIFYFILYAKKVRKNINSKMVKIKIYMCVMIGFKIVIIFYFVLYTLSRNNKVLRT